MVTPSLFARYPTAADYAAADRDELAKIIRSTGFFHAKTTSLIGLGRALCERFGGEVPRTARGPGHAARASAARPPTWCSATPSASPGITVDTHFGRLSRRFGWTTSDDPVKVEAEVGALIPAPDWTMLSHRLIWHGRRVCHARRPACGACALARLCPSFGEGPTDAATAAKLVKPGPFS